MARICSCPINPDSEYYARTMSGEIVGHTALLNYAQRHRMLYRCDDCMGTIADYRRGGTGLLSPTAMDFRNSKRGGSRRSRERVPVIRSVSSSGVSYRFFGESWGLTQHGVNVAALEGFKGTGAGLSQKLNVPAADLAKSLKLPLEEFLTTTFDVSKD